MKKILGFALALLTLQTTLPTSAADIQKWTDANGTTHYGDGPAEEAQAEEMELKWTTPVAKPLLQRAAGEFYGVPLYPEQIKPEKSDPPKMPATLRFLTSSSVATVTSFYKTNIASKYKLETLDDGSIHISYKVDHLDKVILIKDFFGKADVTIRADK
ncbi:MAG: DUF4124 domain-containing protein [Pseudomonadota bacterium]